MVCLPYSKCCGRGSLPGAGSQVPTVRMKEYSVSQNDRPGGLVQPVGVQAPGRGWLAALGSRLRQDHRIQVDGISRTQLSHQARFLRKPLRGTCYCLNEERVLLFKWVFLRNPYPSNSPSDSFYAVSWSGFWSFGCWWYVVVAENFYLQQGATFWDFRLLLQ